MFCNCRVTLKTKSSAIVKEIWKEEVFKPDEEVLALKQFVSVAELPENAKLFFHIRILM